MVLKNIIYTLAFVTLSLSMSACGHVDMSLTHPPDVYTDAQVQKSQLVVSVRPQHRTLYPLKALFYPLVITQDMPDRIPVGRELGRMIHSNWASQNLFSTLAYDDSLAYRSPQQAVMQGRASGADIVICAFIPYLYSGASLDDTAITVHIKIYETGRGQLLWDMIQSGRMNEKMPADWIYFKQHTRLPDSPSYVILNAIASDMAIPLAQWQAGAKGSGPLPQRQDISTYKTNSSNTQSNALPQRSNGPTTFNQAPLPKE